MKNLIQKIEYSLQNSMNENELQNIFLATECDVLSAMKEYKECLRKIEVQNSQKENTCKNHMLTQLQQLDCEKDKIIYLKAKMLIQLNILLKKGTVESWCEILVWYQFVIQEKLATRFWEFEVLKIMLDIFVEEANQCKTITVFQFNNIKEMIDTYYKTVFLLRRLEYDMEPTNEFLDFVEQKKLSFVFVHGVLKSAQIYNKNKVMQLIESRWNNAIK